jgi:glycosyltransferase involved in cell wall biosynthesis
MDITVLVVDNNSTDNTKETVQPFLEQGGLTCKYLFVERPGKSAALNEALAQTNSELVGLIDDDEQVDPSWLEVVYSEFSADPTLDYIGGPYYPNWGAAVPDWLQSYGAAIGVVLRPERLEFTPQWDEILMGGNAVIRRSILQKVLPYPEQLGNIGNKIRAGEDEVIYHRLLRIGARGVNIPNLIIHHWIPAERLTKSYYRKWTIGRGISVGFQLRERGFPERSLFRIPRYLVGNAIRSLRVILLSRSQADRFVAQLRILDCLATLYGRHVFSRNTVWNSDTIAKPE